MILRKIVEVEASERDVVDYLRGLMRDALQFRPGDLVEVDGKHVVVRLWDQTDRTLHVVGLEADNMVHQWGLSPEETRAVRIVERLPLDWEPTPLAFEAAVSTQAVQAAMEEDAAQARNLRPGSWDHLMAARNYDGTISFGEEE